MGLLDLFNAALVEAKAVEGNLVNGVNEAIGEAKAIVAKTIPSPLGTRNGTAPYTPTGNNLLSLPQQIEQYNAFKKKLSNWKNNLASASDNMARKAGASDLVSAVSAWNNGPYQEAVLAVSQANSAAQSIQQSINSGVAPDINIADDYQRNLMPLARNWFSSADNTAQKIYDSIQAAWANFKAQGVPGAATYAYTAVSSVLETAVSPVTIPYQAAKATITGVRNAGVAAENYIERAGVKIGQVAEEAATQTQGILKYAAYGLGAFAVIYLLNFLPRVPEKRYGLHNPRRKRR